MNRHCLKFRAILQMMHAHMAQMLRNLQPIRSIDVIAEKRRQHGERRSHFHIRKRKQIVAVKISNFFGLLAVNGQLDGEKVSQRLRKTDANNAIR